MLDFYDAILGAETIGGGGGGGSATLITKTINENGTYSASSDNADGYSAVTVSVPNTYTQSDEGKVVDNGALVAQTSSSTTSNGTVDTTTINSLTVNVANSYTAGDEGKVVDNGALVSQTAYPSTVTTNGTITTTTNNSVTIDVANSYTQADNGKVVSNQQLVAQTAYPSTITTNNTYDTTNYNSITVNVSGGGGSVESKDVNFYDYDGTIVYSYTAAEFANLSALPANPTHTGLTAQGWNWTLSDAQTYVASYGMLEIGQQYITNDGKTRLYVDLDPEYLNPYIYVSYITSGEEVTIDWGDNTTPDVVTTTGFKGHTYSSAGSYVISLSCDKEFQISGLGSVPCINNGTSTAYRSYGYTTSLKKVEIGSNFTTIGNSCFAKCYSLKTITIPKETQRFENSSFEYSAIKHINIPGKTGSSNHFGGSIFNNCTKLESISLAKNGINTSSNLFSTNNSLKRVTFPESVSSIESNCFASCNSSDLKVIIPNTVTALKNNCFYGCELLKTITIPSSVTSMENCFMSCYTLKEITIPSSVTSIGSSCFSSCYNLTTITINQAEGSISGAPWGAPSATVVWTG